MTTEKEFLEIVHKHLKVDENGCVYTDDPNLEKEYGEYLNKFAIKGGTRGNKGIVINFWCKAK